MSVIREAWESVFRRRDLRPIYEWASENTDLKPPLTITGAFDVSRSRHFISPLDAMQDDNVREVNILKPVRGGGTLLADIFVPWARVNDPGPVLFLLQTDPIADDHFQKVLLPTLESVPEIKRMLDALDRHKKTSRKIEFADGNHLHTNGPSIGNLQTNAFRIVIEDECWLYPDRMPDAEGRCGDFVKMGTSKIIRISQGGPKERLPLVECAWNRAYHNGSVHEWEVMCPLCSEWHEPLFSGTRPDGSFYGIMWDHHKLPNGDWDINKCASTVRFECPHCRRPVLDTARTKSEWNRTGRYKLTTEDIKRRKSFHWEAAIDYPWDELTVLWLDACNAERRGDLGPKLQFYQKRRAMHRDEESLLKSGLNLLRSNYDVESDWPEEKVRFMEIDRQEQDTFWWMVRAYAADGKSRRLGFGKCFGFEECEQIRARFKVAPNRVAIDSGFQPKGDNGVYQACLRYGWVAVKGDREWSYAHRTKNKKTVYKSYAPLTWGDPGSYRAGQSRRYCPLVLFSKNQMNQKTQELIDAGLYGEPSATTDPEMEAEYNTQMAGRIRKVEFDKKTGETKVYWWESKNDHARDLANISTLQAILADCLPDPAAERLTKKETEATNE